jgi:hypothetical protein
LVTQAQLVAGGRHVDVRPVQQREDRSVQVTAGIGQDTWGSRPIRARSTVAAITPSTMATRCSASISPAGRGKGDD